MVSFSDTLKEKTNKNKDSLINLDSFLPSVYTTFSQVHRASQFFSEMLQVLGLGDIEKIVRCDTTKIIAILICIRPSVPMLDSDWLKIKIYPVSSFFS